MGRIFFMNSLEHIEQFSNPLKRSELMQLISCIDLTSLNSNDNTYSISMLCKKANSGFNAIYPAAVCVSNFFTDQIITEINSPIKKAIVSGAFPTGSQTVETKIVETAKIAELQIDEIDYVINPHFWFNQQPQLIEDEIKKVKKITPGKTLKVILETGLHQSKEAIQKIAENAINGGADFIKTSTGKTTIGATPQAVITMCEVIKAHALKTGKKVGIKPSGGIRTLHEATIYYNIVKVILGDEWLNPDYFRIGASSLYDNLIDNYKNLND